ncbi:MAG: cysteine desulfurase family protein [Anaerolineales bacterium]
MPERTYFDYCATTPVNPAVLESMLPCLTEQFGNPSSLHYRGRAADELLEKARQQVANAIGASPNEITFTSGATEANNLALHGVLKPDGPEQNHLITSAIEHHAVLHTAEMLQSQGVDLTVLPVNQDGLVNPKDIQSALQSNTALISIMYVNNEIGSVQPIAEIASLAHEHDIIFHTDAVQALGMYSIDVHALGIDLLSLSAHKIYGPKGSGALYVRDGLVLKPLIYGGPQERELRAGTENLPGIVGLGTAIELVQNKRIEQSTRLRILRQHFVNRLQSEIPGGVINGPREHTAPHVISVSFPGSDAEMMLFRLDQAGFAASMGSACNAESIEPSHVLLALGLEPDRIQGTLRFSLGYPTDEEDIEHLMSVLPGIVEECQVA